MQIRHFLLQGLHFVALVASSPFAPEISPRAALPQASPGSSHPSSFIGYYWVKASSGSGQGLETVNCPSGFVLSTKDSFVQCCSSSETDCQKRFVTGCVGGTAVVKEDATSDCPSGNSICLTDIVFRSNIENLEDEQKWVRCGRNTPRTFFQEMPVLATTNTLFSLSTGSPAPKPSATNALPTTTAPPNDTGPEKEQSKAWVAGAVIGPIAFIAIGGAIFWILRRRRKQNNYAPYNSGSQTKETCSSSNSGPALGLSTSDQNQKASISNEVPPPHSQDEWKDLPPQTRQTTRSLAPNDLPELVVTPSTPLR